MNSKIKFNCFFTKISTILAIFVVNMFLCVSLAISKDTPPSSAAPTMKYNNFESVTVCSKCHQDIHKNWASSMHAHSYDDPIFQAAFIQTYKITKGKTEKYCLQCHAPSTQYTQDYDVKLDVTKEGISCNFCHSITKINMGNDNPYTLEVGDTKQGPYKDITSPAHNTAYSELHKKSELCGGCHQVQNENGVVIMGTYSEWRKSSYYDKGIQCQNCHMPVQKSAKIVKKEIKESPRKVNLHNLEGGHSGKQLKKATKISIISVDRRKNDTKIKVKITNSGAGHMIPTGIPTRNIALEISLISPDGKILAQDKREYKKVIIDKNGKELKTDVEIFLNSYKILSDNRLAPNQSKEEEFIFPITSNKTFKVEAKIIYSYSPITFDRAEMRLEMSKTYRMSR